MSDTKPKAVRKSAKQPVGGVTVGENAAPVAEALAAPKVARKRAAVAKARPAQPAAEQPAARKAKVQEPVADAAKPDKPKKVRLVRDSFTMPDAEYAAIAALKARCLGSGIAARKSEILRAALAALARLNDADLAAAIQGLAAIKTGRPAKSAR